MRFSLVLAGAALIACGPAVQVVGEDDDGAGTGGPGPLSGTFTSSSSSSSSSSTTTSTTSSPATSDSDPSLPPDDCPTGDCDDDEGDVGGDFILVPDGGPCQGIHSACSVWGQDCPEGEKCAPSDWCAIEGQWSATICTPIDPDPGQAGDACSVEDHPASGRDTCDISVLCWNVDPATLTGTCVDLCVGTEVNALCDDPLDACLIANDGTLPICLPTCDPLASACPDGEGCHPVATGEERFVCIPDGAPVYLGSLRPTECSLGETAVPDGRLSSQCDVGDICCTPYCSLSAPDCDAGLECQPWYDPPEGGAEVGVCVDP